MAPLGTPALLARGEPGGLRTPFSLIVRERVAVRACWEVFLGLFEAGRPRSSEAQRTAGRYDRREQQQEKQGSGGSSAAHDGLLAPSASHDALLFSALNAGPAAVPGGARRL